MNKKSQTIQTYRKSAKELSERWIRVEPGGRVQDINKAFSYVKGNDPFVVELGCGNGRDAKVIMKKTRKYLGLDISPELIRIAKKNAHKGNFKVADLENFKFPKNIDIVFSFASLLHSNRSALKNVLNNLYGVLNDQGIVYISLKYGKYGSKTKSDEFGVRTYYFYKPIDIQKLVKGKYQTVYKEVQDLRGQKWFTIVLRKSEK